MNTQNVFLVVFVIAFGFLGGATGQVIEFFGNGCCRFDDYSYKQHGYKTLSDCKTTCLNDNLCIAFDLARPRSSTWSSVMNGYRTEFECSTFSGSGNNFRTECNTNIKGEQCYKVILGKPWGSYYQADCNPKKWIAGAHRTLKDVAEKCTQDSACAMFGRLQMGYTDYYGYFTSYTAYGDYYKCPAGTIMKFPREIWNTRGSFLYFNRNRLNKWWRP